MIGPQPASSSVLTDEAFATLAALIHDETGIVITEAKRTMLVSRLSRRLRHLGLADFSAYLAHLRGREGPAERGVMVSAITTNVTGFFREPHHFELLAREAPNLLRKARGGDRVRLWSAGCSTGQEAISMAAVLADLLPAGAAIDLRILATDIDPAVLQQARDGIYDRALLGASPPPALLRHVVPVDASDRVTFSPRLRSLISFEVLNLLEPWPFHGSFDMIFCRNVVIYFDDDTRKRLWARFAERLLPGGLLCIGHSERMDPDLDHLLRPDGMKTYRRSAGTAPDTQHATAKNKGPSCP